MAAEYAEHVGGELAGKPFDRAELHRFAARTAGGRVCDLGCGPGHVAAHLAGLGADVLGIDLSPGMIAQARARVPDVRFAVGDVASLPAPDAAFRGVLAFYSLIHTPVGGLPAVAAELRRVLAPGGVLLASFHVGTEIRHLAEWWGRDVSVDFHFFAVAEVSAALVAAGFVVETVAERDPYPEVEVATRRAYVWARRPN